MGAASASNATVSVPSALWLLLPPPLPPPQAVRPNAATAANATPVVVLERFITGLGSFADVLRG
ncbi:hypothetical protein GCM10023162_18590 [Klenkia terrae]